MRPQFCVWDWNGTLLDDVGVCIDTMNALLEKRGLARLTLARYREIFTFPVEEYYRAAGFDFAREPFTELAREYIVPYNKAAQGCGLCSGAREALEWLRQQGVRQVVVSASHEDALREQVEQQGVAGYFEAVLGIRDVLGAGKAGLARAYLRAQGADFTQAWCVGDTLHDHQVAREMGCPCLLVAQGHQSAAKLREAGVPVLQSLTALPDFFDGGEKAQPLSASSSA